MTTPIQMKRIPNWEKTLFQFFRETDEKVLTLDWETNNCASWTCDAVQRITGVDLYADFREGITSPMSAYKVIKKAGFDDISDLVTSRLEQVHSAFARFGDICLYPLDASTSMYPGPSAMLGGAAIGGEATAQSLGMMYAMCIAEPPFAWALINTGKISLPITEQCILFKVG